MARLELNGNGTTFAEVAIDGTLTGSNMQHEAASTYDGEENGLSSMMGSTAAEGHNKYLTAAMVLGLAGTTEGITLFSSPANVITPQSFADCPAGNLFTPARQTSGARPSIQSPKMSLRW